MRKQKNRKITVTAFECRRDHLTIRGTQYLPAGTKLPIAIVSHGFMANQDTVRQYAKKLAKLGYAAYCFDFCGGCVIKGKSDGKTTEMSVLTGVKDLEAVQPGRAGVGAYSGKAQRHRFQADFILSGSLHSL